MKKLNYSCIATLLLLCTFFISCNKNDDGDKNMVLSKETISAKWSSTEDNIYTSFEFNESGNYIITGKVPAGKSIKNSVNNGSVSFMTKSASGEDMVIYCGAYRIIDGVSIELINFGTITILDLTSAGRLSAIITKDGEIEITFNAAKEPQIPESARLKLLCRTWTDNNGNYVIISKSGTWCNIDTELIEEVGYAGFLYGNWKWKTGETVFSYGYRDGYWEFFGEVTIQELTSDYIKGYDRYYTSEEPSIETEAFKLYPATNVEFPPVTGPGPKPEPEGPINIEDILGIWECTSNYEEVKQNGVLIPESVENNSEVGDIWTFNANGTFNYYTLLGGDWYMNGDKIVIQNDGGLPYEYTILALDEQTFRIQCTKEFAAYNMTVFRKYAFKRLEEYPAEIPN